MLLPVVFFLSFFFFLFQVLFLPRFQILRLLLAQVLVRSRFLLRIQLFYIFLDLIFFAGSNFFNVQKTEHAAAADL